MGNYYYHAELNEYKPLTLYKMIVIERIKGFPPYYFQGVNGKLRARELVKYLIEDRLGIEINDIPTKTTNALLREHKLYGALAEFNYDLCDLCNFVFEMDWKPWQFTKLPRKFYLADDTNEQLSNWLVLERLSSEIKENQPQILDYIKQMSIRDLHNLCKLDKEKCKSTLSRILNKDNIIM